MNQLFARFNVSAGQIVSILAQGKIVSPVPLTVEPWENQDESGCDVTGPSYAVCVLIGLVAELVDNASPLVEALML